MEYLNEIAFMGLFVVLWMAMSYIYVLSTKISLLLNRVEVIEGVVDITNQESHEMVDRLEKIKISIEGQSHRDFTPMSNSMKNTSNLFAKIAAQ